MTSKPGALQLLADRLSVVRRVLQRADRRSSLLPITSARRGAISSECADGRAMPGAAAAARPASRLRSGVCAHQRADLSSGSADRGLHADGALPISCVSPLARILVAPSRTPSASASLPSSGSGSPSSSRRDQLRGERRPDQAARAVGERAVDAFREPAHHRQPVGRHRAESDAARTAFGSSPWRRRILSRRSRLPASLSARGAGSSSSMSKLAPTTQRPSTGGSTMPPRSTTTCGALERLRRHVA